MIPADKTIYLASKSPRRRKLLKQLNLRFKVVDIHYKEKFRAGEKPADTVKRIAREKMEQAKIVIRNGIIITADTIVVIDNHILGKPKNKKDAERILKILSGNTHFVYTGLSLFNYDNHKSITGFEKTAVTFRKLDDDEIRSYILSGSPMDKAGAYGIQDDFGAVFVKKINGCYYNVVGLPLARLYESLQSITN
jgi:septum formation protein